MHRWIVGAVIGAIGLITAVPAAAETSVPSPYAVRGTLAEPSAGAADALWVTKAAPGGRTKLAAFAGGQWTIQGLANDSWHGLPVELDMTSNADGYLRDRRGNFQHWDGAAWTVLPAEPQTLGIVADISSSGPDDLWVAGEPAYPYGHGIWHWDGTVWNNWVVSELEEYGTQDVAVVSPTDVWALDNVQTSAGYRTRLWHFDGTDWTKHVVPGEEFGYEIGASEAGAWVLAGAGQRRVHHFDGQSWTPLAPPAEGIDHIALGPDDTVWAASYAAAHHYVNGAWTTHPYPPNSCSAQRDQQLEGLTVGRDGAAYVVGACVGPTSLYTLALRWDGTTWERI